MARQGKQLPCHGCRAADAYDSHGLNADRMVVVPPLNLEPCA